MIERIKQEWAEFWAWMRLATNRLAAAAGLASAVLIDNQQILIALLGIIPPEPEVRLLMAIGVGLLVFLVPYVLRKWPQDAAIDNLKQKTDRGAK